MPNSESLEKGKVWSLGKPKFKHSDTSGLYSRKEYAVILIAAYNHISKSVGRGRAKTAHVEALSHCSFTVEMLSFVDAVVSPLIRVPPFRYIHHTKYIN